MYQIELSKHWAISKRPPVTQFDSDEHRGHWNSGFEWVEGDVKNIAGPLERTTNNAPDIDTIAPMILAWVILLLKVNFSILNQFLLVR